MGKPIVIKPNFNRLPFNKNEKIAYLPIKGKVGNVEYLIDGYQRIRYFEEGGMEVSYKIEEYDSLLELTKRVLGLNNPLRELHLLEKSYIIAFAAKNGFSKELGPVLKMKIDENAVRHSEFLVDLDYFYNEIIAGQKLSFKKIAPLFYFSHHQLNLLKPVFTAAEFSQSNFYKYLEMLNHYTRLKDLDITTYTESNAVQVILKSSELSSFEKGEKLLQDLHVKTSPNIAKYQKEMQLIKDNLKAKTGLDIGYDPNFEGSSIRLGYEIAAKDDIDRLIKILDEQKETLVRSLNILNCEEEL